MAELIARDEVVAAPRTSLNKPIGVHRRFDVVRVPLADVKLIKNGLGGTVNDVVLAAATAGLRELSSRAARSPRAKGSVRWSRSTSGPPADRLGNKITLALRAPARRGGESAPALRPHGGPREADKSGSQARGGETLIRLAGLAPPVIHSFLARSLFASRLFNVTITNVPGPQQPLYACGSRMTEVLPLVPLAADHSVGIAVVSYDGDLYFGLIADRDRTRDLDVLSHGIARAIAELRELAATRSSGALAAPGPGSSTGRRRRAAVRERDHRVEDEFRDLWGSSRAARGDGPVDQCRRVPRGSAEAVTRRPVLPDRTSSLARHGERRNRMFASPISSARTPPGPKATSGPNTGTCTSPARSSVPPRPSAGSRPEGQHRPALSTSSRSSSGSKRRRRGRSRAPPAPRSWPTTESQASSRGDGFFLGLDDTLGHERDAVRVEQRRTSFGASQRSSFPATFARRSWPPPGRRCPELRETEPPGAVATPPLRRQPQRGRRRLGIGKRSDRPLAGLKRRPDAFTAHDRGEHRLVASVHAIDSAPHRAREFLRPR